MDPVAHHTLFTSCYAFDHSQDKQLSLCAKSTSKLITCNVHTWHLHLRSPFSHRLSQPILQAPSVMVLLINWLGLPVDLCFTNTTGCLHCFTTSCFVASLSVAIQLHYHLLLTSMTILYFMNAIFMQCQHQALKTRSSS